MRETFLLIHIFFGFAGIFSTSLFLVKKTRKIVLTITALIANGGLIFSGVSLLFLGTGVGRLCLSFFAYVLFLGGVSFISHVSRKSLPLSDFVR